MIAHTQLAELALAVERDLSTTATTTERAPTLVLPDHHARVAGTTFHGERDTLR